MGKHPALDEAVIRATGAITKATLSAPPETRKAVTKALDQLWTDIQAAEADHRHQAFGHGWQEGHEAGVLDGWADRDNRAARELAEKDAELAALRSQLEARTLQQVGQDALDSHTAEDIGTMAAALGPTGRLIHH